MAENQGQQRQNAAEIIAKMSVSSRNDPAQRCADLHDHAGDGLQPRHQGASARQEPRWGVSCILASRAQTGALGIGGALVRLPQHIYFAVQNETSSYEVSLLNPLDATRPWRFKTEWLTQGDKKLISRSPRMRDNPNTERGLAALTADELKEGSPARGLIEQMQEFVIYSPTTPVLRGKDPESAPSQPVGLHGGRLPEAIHELLISRKKNIHAKRVSQEALSLIDWAKRYGSAAAVEMPLSPAAGASPRVIRFVDRYMREGRNVLSGYDASEGALYILFLAVLAAHKDSPHFFAVDNADHGLNPRLAKALFKELCGWILDAPQPRQILITTHNPQVLGGLPLRDDRVRLFTVARTDTGRSVIRRVEVDEKLLAMAEKGWTLSRLWVMGHLGGVPNV